jgi:SAM-dependent methyltransferase
MSTPPRFAAIARGLREAIIDHHELRGERLDNASGLITLDTNSTLAAERGRLLLRLLAEVGGPPIDGLRLLDLGAGFGALALYFAHLGADVVAVDRRGERLSVGAEVARRHGLRVSTVNASAEDLPLVSASFDLVVANNSLCYVVDTAARACVFAEVLRVLKPGGWLVVRNPNRLTPIDPFTGLPLITLLPQALARRLLARLGRPRSEVRLLTPSGAVRELRRAGFTDVRFRSLSGVRRPASLDRYQHLVARRPG